MTRKMTCKHRWQNASLLVHATGPKVLERYAQLKAEEPKGSVVSKAQILMNEMPEPIMTMNSAYIISSLSRLLKPYWHENIHFSMPLQTGIDQPENMLRFENHCSTVGLMGVTNSMDKISLRNYASRLNTRDEATILFHLQYERPVGGIGVKITHTAEIFVDRGRYKHEVGLLWRESYQANTCDDIDKTMYESFIGILHFLDCAKYLSEILPNHCVWNRINRAVAADDEYIYKIFDNRAHREERKLGNWLPSDPTCHYSWLDNLGVEEFLAYEETKGVKKFLGDAVALRDYTAGYQGDTRARKEKEIRRIMGTPIECPHGSVVIIRCKYLRGTHEASKVSHFANIAEEIQKFHQQNMVHGDIRGFNMIHPYESENKRQNGVQRSCLIDFDLSGKHGEGRYPLGFNSRIDESDENRIGTPGGLLLKHHDWFELGAAMSMYSVSRYATVETHDAWLLLCNTYKYYYGSKGTSTTRPDRDCKEFIEKFGDVSLVFRGKKEEGPEIEAEPEPVPVPEPMKRHCGELIALCLDGINRLGIAIQRLIHLFQQKLKSCNDDSETKKFH
jgi:hypothetical protein